MTEPKNGEDSDKLIKKHIIIEEKIKDLKTNVESIEERVKSIEISIDRRKNLMILFIFINILIACGGLFLQKIQIDNELSESLISDVTAIEHPKRMGIDEELYQLTFHNYGEVENDLQITITFTLDTKILDIWNIDEESLIINESKRYGDSEYFVRYEKIRAGEEITLRFDLENDQLSDNESILIYPNYINAYTDEGKINIYPSAPNLP